MLCVAKGPECEGFMLADLVVLHTILWRVYFICVSYHFLVSEVTLCPTESCGVPHHTGSFGLDPCVSMYAYLCSCSCFSGDVILLFVIDCIFL